MVNIRQKVQKLKEDILELDSIKQYKDLKIKELYSQCDHDFKPVYKGHTISIYICNLCGYKEELKNE